MIASAPYYVDSATRLADVAYLVDPAWQGKGLGARLQWMLSDYAIRHGVVGFTADVLEENVAMLRVFDHGVGVVDAHVEGGVHEVLIDFGRQRSG